MDEFQEIQIDNISQDSAAVAAAAPAPVRSFEELTLLEMLRVMLRHPFSSLGALSSTLMRPTTADVRERYYVTETDEDSFDFRLWVQQFWSSIQPLSATLAALLIALFGSVMLVTSPDDISASTLKLGLMLMFVASAILAVVTARNFQIDRLPPLTFGISPLPLNNTEPFLKRYGLRLALFGVSLLWAAGTWLFTGGNNFSGVGIFCWIMSILTMTAALLDRNIFVGTWFRDRWLAFRTWIEQGVSIRLNWTLFALVMILLVGALLRFGSLSNVPPDMTSDHVEKLLDSMKIYEGARPIFLPNNGGREVFQMYFIAFIKSITGLPFNFELLKLVSGLEGMVEIVLAYFLGRALFGEEDRQFGNLVGLSMAALVATSFWHVLLSRLGLRIVMTTLVVTVALIYFARALRYNRRADYVLVGLILGFGLYTYQAVRMFPLVIVAGVIIALIMRARSGKVWREYVTNFIALVLISLVVFVPLAHYMSENAEDFWNRTSGRIFGDAYREGPNGEQTPVPFSERLAAFQNNLPVLNDNIVKSLLMFNWKGDRSWFNGSPEGTPAMDYFTGAMFILGLGIIILRIIKRRDPVDLLLLVGIFIMILPSALAIAFTIEVPGFTRASGALPEVYLIAALGLAVIIRLIAKKATIPWVRTLLYGIIVVLILIGVYNNYTAYFVNAMKDYRESTLPHRQAGKILRGFIDSTGAPGNAFVLAYRYWWDHRAVAIESGDPHWPNTIPDTSDLPNTIISFMQMNMTTDNGKYALNPNRQLLFFVSQEDVPTQGKLKEIFPQGQLMKIASYNPTRDFYIFIAPSVGCEWAKEKIGATFRECPDDASATPTPPGP